MSEPDQPILFFLHGLGGSARSWAAVADRLGRFRCVAVDLPGFGDAAALPGWAVLDMANHVVAAIRDQAPPRWALIGHSMGAKIASVVARRAEDGEPGLDGLTGLVLLAGSPPGPEPMGDDQRAAMRAYFVGGAEQSGREAHGFIAQNIGAALDPATHEGAAADTLRADTGAWRAWLDTGSREDWAARVGRLRTPALLVAGGADGPLGPEAQFGAAAAHFENARVVVLDGAGHLLPLERPDDVARLVEEHLTSTIPLAYRALLATDRVSARTREILSARGAAAKADPTSMDVGQFETLRALVARLVPQTGARPIDLAARIEAELAGTGDGWRYASLPPDAQAYRQALDTIDAAARSADGRRFAGLDGAGQDDLLRLAAAAALHGAPFDAMQMKLWFEEVLAAATRAYAAHPATLARIGYSGIANGGDGERKSGFVRTGLGEREPWEPVATGAAS